MTTHATTLDIQAILTARRAALEAAVAAAHAAAVKPATPVKPAPIGTPASAAVPTPVPAAPIVPDADLVAFISRSIPALRGAVEAIVAPPLKVSEVLDLIQLISTLVRDGLPQAQGQDARAITIALFRGAVDTFVTPRLPVFLRPFVPGMITAAISALEAIYQASVKRRS